jgi:7-carboxy-7-deazaguanine synthase
VNRIIDVKTPSCGEGQSFFYPNFDVLRPNDEVKFPVMNKDDFLWAVDIVNKNGLLERCPVSFSPVLSSISAKELADLIIESNLSIRLNLQLHKFIGVR